MDGRGNGVAGRNLFVDNCANGLGEHYGILLLAGISADPLWTRWQYKTREVGKEGAKNFPALPLRFLVRKEKARTFSGRKNFADPGDPDFFGKIRNRLKFHDGEKPGELVVHPIIG